MKSVDIRKSLEGLVLVSSFAGCGDNNPDYKNPDLPIEKRVSDLLKRMTLEEKAAQMIAAEKDVKLVVKQEGVQPG